MTPAAQVFFELIPEPAGPPAGAWLCPVCGDFVALGAAAVLFRRPGEPDEHVHSACAEQVDFFLEELREVAGRPTPTRVGLVLDIVPPAVDVRRWALDRLHDLVGQARAAGLGASAVRVDVDGEPVLA